MSRESNIASDKLSIRRSLSSFLVCCIVSTIFFHQQVPLVTGFAIFNRYNVRRSIHRATIHLRPENPKPDSIMTTALNKRSSLFAGSGNPTDTRIELFFKDNNALKERVQLLSSKSSGGFSAFSLVNKDKKDRSLMLKWAQIIREASCSASTNVCIHYSMKYNKANTRTNPQDANFDILVSFLKSLHNELSKKELECTEVLLISGTGPKNNRWDTIQALKRLKGYQESEEIPLNLPKLAVAFNPFFPANSEEQSNERLRLSEKLETKLVSKVYFQFGSNTDLLYSSMEWLKQQQISTKFELAGSMFLPTKQLIAQQKFRPWNGVFLCDKFLSSPEGAKEIVLEMMTFYQRENIEILFEAPGVRTEKDVALVKTLFSEITKNSVSNGSSASMLTNKPSSASNMKNSQLSIISSPSSLTKIMQPSPKVDKKALKTPCILIFGSHDVRLHDNHAVEFASCHSKVVPVFLWCPVEQGGKWGVRGALEVVLKDALSNLDKELKKNGLKLLCRNTNDTTKEILKLCEEVGASAVYWNKDHTPEGRVLESKRSASLQKLNLVGVECSSSLLYDPTQVSCATGFHGGHWGTLMPFLKTCKKQLGEPKRPTPRHKTMQMLEAMTGPESWPVGVCVNELDLCIVKGEQRWDLPIKKAFPMSEVVARNNLSDFFSNGFQKYETERSRADLDSATSKLSPHLRIGTLSPYELYYRTEDSNLSYDEKKTFSRRLIWRDLAYFHLHSFPQMREMGIREHYDNVEWVTGEEEKRRFEAWKWGRTGYPIVDAGMRELYETGWMTQSVRMVVASFLVEYLRVNWVKGCEWFHYTLVDADSAINAMMWQNAGRSGIDQWNFVLSPETASQDRSGSYTRRWVPELAALSKPFLHKPWTAPKDVLKDAKIVIGKTYPHRIVSDLKMERNRSVDAVLKVRRDSQMFNNDRGYDLITLPDGKETVVFTKKEYRIDRSGNVMKETKSNVATSKRKRARRR